MIGVAWQSKVTEVTDRNSLLYNIVAGEEIIEGPLDPSAYASTGAPGVGGARLATLEGNVGIELITFDDPEVSFANTLGGNAIIAPLSPLEPEPGSQETAPLPSTQKSRIYTIQDGDTVASISARHNVSTNTILWANGLSKNNTIRVGDHLTILPTTGVLHTVKSGDTVLMLAKVYEANATDIIKYNSLNEDAKLNIGQKVIVPDGYISPRSAPQVAPSSSGLADSGTVPPPSTATGTGLIWPTTSRHLSQYFRWGHTGIDIDNRSRPPIYAAAAGTVQFSGRLGGYGNLVIINHGGGLTTYYAHNEINYVKKGETVAKGTAIAKVGSTGRSTGPHLHFEVRKHGRPINPLSMY